MEYLKKADYTNIKKIIEGFVGSTMLGNNIFKALKVYFKQKDIELIKTYAKKEYLDNQPIHINHSDEIKINLMKKEADEALLNYNNKLKEQINGIKKKAN